MRLFKIISVLILILISLIFGGCQSTSNIEEERTIEALLIE